MNKNKKKNNKNRKKPGKRLAEQLYARKLKKAAKRGDNIFICEPHAHHQNACGLKFASKHGWVECPACGNQYCRWTNYEEPKDAVVP